MAAHSSPRVRRARQRSSTPARSCRKRNSRPRSATPFETPQDSSLGPFKASCRFPAKAVDGDDLNLFLTNDLKGGIKDSIGTYFATAKSFAKVYGEATPVTGIGKEAYSAFDDTASIAQGALLVLDGKNHAALIVSTGGGVTAENNVTRGEAVAKIVLPELK